MAGFVRPWKADAVARGTIAVLVGEVERVASLRSETRSRREERMETTLGMDPGSHTVSAMDREN